jgi:hypothetical protein
MGTGCHGHDADAARAGGAATFYSSRTRTTGEVTFCVTSVQAAGLAYDGSSNLVDCGSVVK